MPRRLRGEELAKRLAGSAKRKAVARFVATMAAAPVMETLIPSPVSREPVEVVDVSALVAPRFGLTDDDLRAGLQAHIDRCEALAWRMLRTCQQCRKTFLPARGNCCCCSRGCYLRFYRKVRATQYRDATRRYRARLRT